MGSRRTTISINRNSHQESHPYSEGESSQDYSGEGDSYDDEDELDPSDSASASAYDDHVRSRSRGPSRAHKRQSRPPSGRPVRAPQVPNSMADDTSDDWANYGRGGFGHHAPQHQGYYGGRGGGYGAQSVVGGFMGGPSAQYGPPGPIAHYAPPHGYQNGFGGNPFTPHQNGGPGSAFFEQPPARPYDMVPYQPYGAYAGPAGFPPVPAHMQGYMFPPPAPPTEVPAKSATPAPPPEPKPDPAMEAIKKQLAELQAKEDKATAAAEAKAREDQIRKDAEYAFTRRMEDMRKAQEEAQKQIEKAKQDAERAARERMEAERKAEDERRKLHEETMKRVEREAREKIEAEARAAEERRKAQEEAMKRAEADARAKLEAERVALEAKRKQEAEAAALAEAALKAKIEAAEAAAKAKVEADMKAEAEAKAATAKKAAEDAEWRKKLEEEAKLKAEVEARAKLEKEKEEAEKAAADAKQKKEMEEAFKNKFIEEGKLKAEAEKLKAEADEKNKEKPPIKFKDAVGRKFSFPFHLCQNWTGMEELIKQAFLHVEVIGPHVQEGHYDLIGPDGEIILPSVWDKVIKPDSNITMHMWPMDKVPLRQHHPQITPQYLAAYAATHNGQLPPGVRVAGRGAAPGVPPAGVRGVRMAAAGAGGPPPVPPGWHAAMMAGMRPPPGGPGRGAPVQAGAGGPRIVTVGPETAGKKERKSSKPHATVLSWMTGGGKPAKTSNKKKKDR